MEENKVYLDTSAYLSVLLKENPWRTLQQHLKKSSYLTSCVLFLEAHRTLVRLSREGLLTEEDYDILLKRLHHDQDLFAIRDLTLDLCSETSFPAVSLPKTLDLIHLRTALWWKKKEGDLIFLTLDQKQRRAAEELGLSAPEIHK